MNIYSWGVDGIGRQHICLNYENIILLCVIPGQSVYECIEDLKNVRFI